MTDDVWERVIADMHARRQTGLDRYGKPVRAADPEDWLQHLTEEIYDAAVYLKALRLRLTWTTDLPTVPGVYWVVGPDWLGPEMVRVNGRSVLYPDANQDPVPLSDYEPAGGHLWAGPVDPPPPPAGGFPPPAGQ